jgi:hypothetical protein
MNNAVKRYFELRRTKKMIPAYAWLVATRHSVLRAARRVTVPPQPKE